MGLHRGSAVAARAMAGLLLCLFSGKVLAQTADTIVDWAASANGGVASVSSTASSADYPAASLNDGAWLGSTWGHGDGWRAAGKANEWAQVTFATAQTIHAVTLYSAPDGVVVDADGIDARTFTRVGAVEFDVQVSNGHGNNWKTVAHVSSNHLIKRSVSFAPVSAGAVRVICTSGGTEGIGLVELEAWGASGIGNVALPMASKNKNKTPAPTATITADSASEELYPATAMVDGIVDGKDWGKAATGGWMSAGEGAFPTTVELAFEKPQVLDAVTLWTLQDDYEQGAEPTDSTTFTKWGLTAFDVQVWRNGWVTVAQITDNNLVKRTVTFAPTAAMRLRIVAKAGLAGAARIVELQAWGVEMAGLPRLTGLRPQQAAVGETVTLSGENFSRIATANQVLFNGVAAEVVQASATSLAVKVPQGASKGHLSLTVNGIQSVTGGDFVVTSAAQTGGAKSARAAAFTASGTGPTIDNFSPAKGAPGTTVTIVGSGFDPNPANNTVQFGGTYATVNSASPTSLAVTAPNGDTGSISVTVGGNTAVSAGFYYYAPYGIAFTPTSGPAELTSLTITGRNIGYATVNFTGGVSSSSATNSTMLIYALVANGAQTGPITLTNWDMTSAPSLDVFTVTHPAPTITSFTPTSGKPGDVIQINGSNFSPTIANNVVKFNGVTATISDRSNAGGWLKAVVPMTATTGKISVTKDGQTATSSGTFTVNPLAAQAAAFVAQTPPPSTMIAGQTAAVSVTMQNIGSTTWTAGQLYRLGSQNGVDWGVGQRVALPNDVAYGQQVTFNFTVTAPGTPGSYGFVWQMLQDGVGWFGTIAPSAAVTVTPVTLSASGVSPVSASVDQSVTISGTGFSSTATANTVKFTGSATAATVTAASNNSLTVTVPGDASPGPITVTVNGQSVTTPDFYLVPVFRDFTPTQGPIGTSVTINGSGFGASQGTSVIGLGGTIMSVSSWTSTRIVATIPNGASTNPFSIRDSANRIYSSGTSFQVAPPVPTISGLSVTHGMVGDSVIFTGTNFSTAAGGNVVKFNGVASTTVTPMTSTKLTATVPPGATTGPVSVSVGVSTGTGPSFTVDPTPAATCSSAAAQTAVVTANTATQRVFAYNVQNAADVKFPTWWVEENNANDLQWLQGINAGGGTWYADVPHAQYDPGNPRYGQFITRVWMTNPAYNNNALQLCGADVRWVWQAPLTITGITPASASIGRSITINGTGFLKTAASNAVVFTGNNSPAQVTAATLTALTVVVPANARDGAISVTVNGQTATTAANAFQVIPEITGFTPTEGPPGTRVTINGTGFDALATGLASIGLPGKALTIKSYTNTQIIAEIPDGASSGPFTYYVNASAQATSPQTFTVKPIVPVINGFTPPEGGSIGTVVRIDGANFSMAANGNTIKFNGVVVPAANVTNISATQVKAVVPAGAATGKISVTVNGQTGTSQNDFVVATQAAAFVTQTVPATMTSGQSYPVSITMQNIGSATWTIADGYKLASQAPPGNMNWGLNRVALPNDVASGQNVTFNFSVVAPAEGTYDFQWGVLKEGSPSFAAFSAVQTVVVAPVPLTISALTPESEIVGNTIVLTGTGFKAIPAGGPDTSVNIVTFTGSTVPAAVTAVDATKTHLTVTVPDGVRYGPVTVKVGTQSATSTKSFNPKPDVKGFTPTSGGPGTRVTISGTGFDTSTGYVKIGELYVPVMSWNPTTIEVLITRALQSGPFTVINGNGASGTGKQPFNFLAPPPTPLTIRKLYPPRGTYLNTVRIQGTGFSTAYGGTQVVFSNGVKVDDAKVNVTNSQWLEVPVPLTASTGPITITVGTQTAVSAEVFTMQPVPLLDAQFVAEWPQNIYQMRNTIAPGQTMPGRVDFRNAGSTTWTKDLKIRLAGVNPDWTWVSGNRVELSGPVAPGEVATFFFDMKAPTTLGVYSVQWQMVQDTDPQPVYFGSRSNGTVVNVGKPEDFPARPLSVTAVPVAGYNAKVDWQPATTGVAPTYYNLMYKGQRDNWWTVIYDHLPLTPTSFIAHVGDGSFYLGIQACTESLCSDVTPSPLITAIPDPVSCAGLQLSEDAVGFQANDSATTTRQVNVTAPTGCVWGVRNQAAGWLTVTPQSGTSSGTITLAPKGPNTTATEYTGTVIVEGKDASKTLAVSQAASTACSLTVAPGNVPMQNGIVQMPASGGTMQQAINVTTNGCAWNVAFAEHDWLTATPDHGTGNSSLSFTASANAGPNKRTAVLTFLVDGLTPVKIAVSQAGTQVIPPNTPVSDNPVAISIPSMTDSESDKVGATAAQFRVDEGGNATYSIPIQVPPGTAGVAPKLALSYNSRLPNGVMGPGWAIEGSSQISRCRQTRESGDFMSGTTPVDGNPLPVNFSRSDRFCLDGVRLLLLSDNIANNGKSYGDNGTVYSPENDPTTKVTVSSTSTSAGPESFAVKRKDGTTSSYGATADSKAIATPVGTSVSTSVNVSWNLAHVQDSTGNYIDYVYIQRPGVAEYPFLSGAVESVLTEVKYTGNVNQAKTPYASVVFNYVTLKDGLTNEVRLGYQGGVTFSQTQRLTSVTVKNEGMKIRHYWLDYPVTGSNLTRLQDVQECRDDTARTNNSAVCFAPTTFTWSDAQTALQLEPLQSTDAAPNFEKLLGFKIADVDGDGRQDFVWAINRAGTCGGNSAIYVGFADRTSSGQLTFTTQNQAPYCASMNLEKSDRSWYLLDYDGDGRADLLIGGEAGSNWKVFSSKGRPASANAIVFGTADLLASMAPITVPAGTKAVGILADVNGDGLPDFITPNASTSAAKPKTAGKGGTLPDYRIDSGYSVRLMKKSGGTLSFDAPHEIYLFFKDGDGTCQPLDGYRECAFDLINTNTQSKSAIVSDYDGDGRADLMILVSREPCSSIPTPTSCQPMLRSGGTQGVPGDDTPPPTGEGPPTPILAYWYQFNADGISTPDGFSEPVQIMQAYNRLDTANHPGLPQSTDNMFSVDLTGDGLADLIYRDTRDSKTYHVLINNGRGYNGTEVTFTNIENVDFLRFADVNGDGKTDLIFPAGDAVNKKFSTYKYVSLTMTASGWAPSSPNLVPGGGVYSFTDWVTAFGDFDGDGALDYLGVSVAGISTGNLYTSRSPAASRYQPHDVITGFANGLGATTTVVYQPLTNKGVYQWCASSPCQRALTQAASYGYGSPVFDVVAPMYVVSQASSSAPKQNDAAAKSNVRYRYAGAKMQAGGRGFLGFAQVWAYDDNDAGSYLPAQYVVTANAYAQNYPFVGMPLWTTRQVFDGSKFSFGSTELETCAQNVEAAGVNCFAMPDESWPNPTGGRAVSLSKSLPFCNGASCTGTNPAAGSCSAKRASGPTTTANLALSVGGFSPSAVAGPIFAFAAQTSDAQYDLGTGAATAQTDAYMCYGDDYANLTASNTVRSDGNGAIFAQKLLANTYANDTSSWYLGRLTASTVTFSRPDTPALVTRTTQYAYDMAGTSTPSSLLTGRNTGLLVLERIQSGKDSQDLRTLYDLDGYGNRRAAYQCSADVGDAECRGHITTSQRQDGATVLRYAKTDYDSIGRYTTSSTVPFFSGNTTTAAQSWNEQAAVTIDGNRDEFGNATKQASANGLTQVAKYGALGRPYYAADSTGKSSTTTFANCGSGTACPSDARFRSKTVARSADDARQIGATTWTYFDVLGRPILKVSEGFDGTNQPSAQRLIGVCSYSDAHNRPIKQSEPFFIAASGDGGPSLSGTACTGASYYTNTNYDVLGRTVSVSAPDNTTIIKDYAGLVTTTVNQRQKRWTTQTNALGEVVQSNDPGAVDGGGGDTASNLSVTTSYRADGAIASITRNAGNGNIVTRMEYDDLGRRTKLIDPDAGTMIYTYNAAGDVIAQQDAKGQTVAQSYDAQGRRWQRLSRNTSPTGEVTTLTDDWSYDVAVGGLGQLGNETRAATNGQQPYTRSYAYDSQGRLYQQTTTINVTASYTETTAYDAYGRVKASQDASGYSMAPRYTARGFVDLQRDNRVSGASANPDNTWRTIYEAQTMTARGQVASDRRGDNNALASASVYDVRNGRLSRVCAGNGAGFDASGCTTTTTTDQPNALQNLRFSFDEAGNLRARSHVVNGQAVVESFAYDALNRLTQVSVPRAGSVDDSFGTQVAMSLAYDALGNVCTKTDQAGTQSYTYAGMAGCAGAQRLAGRSPHAVVQIAGANAGSYTYDGNGNQVTGAGRTLTYDALNQLTLASNSGDSAQFQYAGDGKRFQRVDKNGTRTTYLGSVEIVVTGTTTEIRRYLAGVAIDYVRSSGNNETRYTFGDHLGSADVIADATGKLIEATSFDAHGKRRSADDWQTPQSTGLASTTHGFTGHEQLDSLGLIHMNGRIYDPALGRMLQADPMQDPGSQGLNRYSYVANNPLTLTDPSGYSWFSNILRTVAAIAITIWAPYLSPVLQGFWGTVAIGFVSGYVATGSLQGALIGAFSAGVFYGIGKGFDALGKDSWAYSGGTIGEKNLNWIGYSAKVVAHGIAGGVGSVLGGGKFGNGFVSAGVTQAFSPAIDGLDRIDNPVGQSLSAQRIVAAAMVGGTASVLSGGKFANGAITGAFSRAFNDDNPFHKPEYKQIKPVVEAEADAHIGIFRDGILSTEADFGGGSPEVTLVQGHYKWVGGGIEVVDGKIGPFVTIGPELKNEYVGVESILKLPWNGRPSWETSASARLPNFYGVKAFISVKNIAVYPSAIVPAATAIQQNVQEATLPRMTNSEGRATVKPDWLRRLQGN